MKKCLSCKSDDLGAFRLDFKSQDDKQLWRYICRACGQDETSTDTPYDGDDE